jgi:hypothetical protein
MFGREGAERQRLDRLLALINQGTDPAVAVKESLGRVEDFEGPLKVYVEQPLFPYAWAALAGGRKLCGRDASSGGRGASAGQRREEG